MMKKEFNNLGVYALQEEILQMHAEQRMAVINQMKADFQQFIVDHFYLSPSQIKDLNNLSTSFINHLTTHIAGTWERSQFVLFEKKEPQEGENIKDIITRPHNTIGTIVTEEYPFLIWIRYRSA